MMTLQLMTVMKLAAPKTFLKTLKGLGINVEILIWILILYPNLIMMILSFITETFKNHPSMKRIKEVNNLGKTFTLDCICLGTNGY